MNKKKRYFRATFYDAASPDRNFVIEFEVPAHYSSNHDYHEMARRALYEQLNAGLVKIRDIEPVET